MHDLQGGWGVTGLGFGKAEGGRQGGARWGRVEVGDGDGEWEGARLH